jgi:predicted SAM-dependent methyltransferase
MLAVSAPRAAVRDVALAGLRVVLRGDRHECPCCGSTFARFIPRDESLLCPRCRSRERQRTLWLYLRDEVGIERSDARVLHLAPEAPLTNRLRELPALRYETADIAPGPLVDRTLDARALPFADGSLDLILCSHVLEHVPEDVQVASEFARVLAPGGQALVQVPVDEQLQATYEDASIVDPQSRLAAFGQFDHVRIYGADVIDRLRAGGLEVTLIPYADRLGAELRFRYLLAERGPRPGGDIYRCAVPSA